MSVTATSQSSTSSSSSSSSSNQKNISEKKKGHDSLSCIPLLKMIASYSCLDLEHFFVFNSVTSVWNETVLDYCSQDEEFWERLARSHGDSRKRAQWGHASRKHQCRPSYGGFWVGLHRMLSSKNPGIFPATEILLPAFKAFLKCESDPKVFGKEFVCPQTGKSHRFGKDGLKLLHLAALRSRYDEHIFAGVLEAYEQASLARSASDEIAQQTCRRGRTCLFAAAESGNLATFQSVLEHCDVEKTTKLMQRHDVGSELIATIADGGSDNVDLVEFLLNPIAHPSFESATQEQKRRYSRLLVDKVSIHCVINRCRETVVNYCIRKCANKVVHFLIRTKKQNLLHHRGASGCQPIHAAAACGNIEAFKSILEADTSIENTLFSRFSLQRRFRRRRNAYLVHTLAAQNLHLDEVDGGQRGILLREELIPRLRQYQQKHQLSLPASSSSSSSSATSASSSSSSSSSSSYSTLPKDRGQSLLHLVAAAQDKELFNLVVTKLNQDPNLISPTTNDTTPLMHALLHNAYVKEWKKLPPPAENGVYGYVDKEATRNKCLCDFVPWAQKNWGCIIDSLRTDSRRLRTFFFKCVMTIDATLVGFVLDQVDSSSSLAPELVAEKLLDAPHKLLTLIGRTSGGDKLTPIQLICSLKKQQNLYNFGWTANSDTKTTLNQAQVAMLRLLVKRGAKSIDAFTPDLSSNAILLAVKCRELGIATLLKKELGARTIFKIHSIDAGEFAKKSLGISAKASATQSLAQKVDEIFS